MTGFLRSLSRSATRAAVNPVHPRDPQLASLFGLTTDSIPVTPQSAMRVTAVYACVTLISETLAALPLHVLKREGKISAKATSHPLYRIMHDQPAPGVTSFEWREMMIGSTALRGDAFARIVIRQNGQVEALPVIDADHISVERDENGLPRYRWTPNGTGPQQILFDDEVLRIPHKLHNGVFSQSPIAVHKSTIGNSLASSQYLQSFFQNSAQPKGALVSPGEINKEAALALRKSWEDRHMGPHNAGRITILDGGLKWEQIGLSHDDAQYIELQQFSISDIARIFLVPPHKIGDLSKATFSNIEHQGIDFVVSTILRWVRRNESRYDLYLLSEADRRAGFHIAFDLKGLLRGDAKARGELYKVLFFLGAMSPNEIRAAEDMNPHKDGDRFFVQVTTAPIDQIDVAMAARVEKTTRTISDE